MKRRLEIVNELLAAIEKDPRSRNSIAMQAGLSQAVMTYWFDGTTKNPALTSMGKVAYVLGMHIALGEGQHLRLEPIETIAVPARTRVHVRRSWLRAGVR